MIEIKDLGFGVIEIFDKDTQYAPAQSIKIGNNTYIREDLINKQIADLQHRLEVANKMGRDAEKENQQLKQQLHDLPKKIVEEIKDKIPEIGGMKCEIIIDDSLTLNTLLDTILKKYGDKNGSNND